MAELLFSIKRKVSVILCETFYESVLNFEFDFTARTLACHRFVINVIVTLQNQGLLLFIQAGLKLHQPFAAKQQSGRAWRLAQKVPFTFTIKIMLNSTFAQNQKSYLAFRLYALPHTSKEQHKFTYTKAAHKIIVKVTMLNYLSNFQLLAMMVSIGLQDVLMTSLELSTLSTLLEVPILQQ